MKNLIFTLTLIAILFADIKIIYSQESDELMELSLEDLLNVDITIASKKTERLFDSPMSTSVITSEAIEKSGARSIPEIFKLVPGFSVREITNNNFYVSERPSENMPVNADLSALDNSSTLVMIDNMVVFNYFQGGTFWETFPISINDIERIEIVRGAASALYGPNAVNGVINIITKNTTSDKPKFQANGEIGTFGSMRQNVNVTTKIKNASVRVSQFASQYDMYNLDFYSLKHGAYIDYNNLSDSSYKQMSPPFAMVPLTTDSALKVEYPNNNQSLKTMGANINVSIPVDENIKFDVFGGLQSSEALTSFLERLKTTYSTRQSNSNYINFRGQVHDLTLQYSKTNGQQDVWKGVSGYRFNFNNTDYKVEYNINVSGLSIKPGLYYSEQEYSDPSVTFLQETVNMQTIAYGLRSEYTFFRRLRVIAGARYDNYNYPKKNYLSYQAIASYKINDNNLIRLNVSRANKSPFILNTYMNASNGMFGSKDLNLLVNNQIELGYRLSINEYINIDLEAFNTKYENFVSLNYLNTFLYEDNINWTPANWTTLMTDPKAMYMQYENISAKLNQQGYTATVNFALSKRFSGSVFATQQINKVESFTPNLNRPDSLINFDNAFIPSIIGGVYLAISPINKLDIGLSMYYSGSSSFTHHTANKTPANEISISAKATANIKIAYKIYNENSLYVNVRNLSINNDPEFPFASKINPIAMIGLNFNF